MARRGAGSATIELQGDIDSRRGRRRRNWRRRRGRQRINHVHKNLRARFAKKLAAVNFSQHAPLEAVVAQLRRRGHAEVEGGVETGSYARQRQIDTIQPPSIVVGRILRSQSIDARGPRIRTGILHHHRHGIHLPGDHVRRDILSGEERIVRRVKNLDRDLRRSVTERVVVALIHLPLCFVSAGLEWRVNRKLKRECLVGFHLSGHKHTSALRN